MQENVWVSAVRYCTLLFNLLFSFSALFLFTFFPLVHSFSLTYCHLWLPRPIVSPTLLAQVSSPRKLYQHTMQGKIGQFTQYLFAYKLLNLFCVSVWAFHTCFLHETVVQYTLHSLISGKP